MLRKLLFVFLFFISIRIYAVAETTIFDGYLNHTEPEKKILESIMYVSNPMDTTRIEVILPDSTYAQPVHSDTIKPIPFFYFEQKMSSYKGWLKSFQVF